jgi:uncharacterized membrane protein
MFVVALSTAGLGLLLAVGVWQAWTGRLTVTGGGSQLSVDDVAYPTRADLREPRRLLRREKLANLLLAQLELVAVVVAGVMATLLATHPSIGLGYRVLIVGTYLVGAYLVGRVVWIRLGLPTPGIEAAGEGVPSVPELAATLREDVGDAVGDDFAAVHEAMATARGPKERLDVVTVALLAGARNGVDREAVATWAAEHGVASEATVASRADALAEQGLLASDAELAFTSADLRDAEPAAVGSIAETVLD